MAVTSPSTQTRAALKTVIESEFSAENFTVLDDRLHESLGDKGVRIGTSPVREYPSSNNMNVLNSEILVQFYGKWRKEIDPTQQVDPSIIEGYAERFRRAVNGADPKTEYVWFFNVLEISYPNDPTGNKTRFEARVLATGENSAIIETSG